MRNFRQMGHMGQFGDTAPTNMNDNEGSVWAPGQVADYTIPALPQDWFSYPLVFGALAPLASLTQTIQIDASADFYLTQIEQITTLGGTTAAPTEGTAILPLATMLINDGGSNRNLMQNGVLIPSLTGSGRWPHYLRHPRMFARNSTITVTIVSVDATNTYSALFINFEGFKTYNN